MSRFDVGWVKVHRAIVNSDIGNDFVILGVWVTLIMWANLRQTRKCSEYEQIEVPRGSILTSTSQVASAGGISRSRAQRVLQYLAKTKRIEMKAIRRGTLITICNYDKYQDIENAADTRRSSDVHHTLHHSNTDVAAPLAPIEEEKKERRKEGKNITYREQHSSYLFLKIWNDNCGNLPKADELTPERVRLILFRLREQPELTYWDGLIKKLAQSDLASEWATFDWLIKDATNHVKVREGNYDRRLTGSLNDAKEQRRLDERLERLRALRKEIDAKDYGHESGISEKAQRP